jgi:hypothetical protein
LKQDFFGARSPATAGGKLLGTEKLRATPRQLRYSAVIKNDWAQPNSKQNQNL